MKKLSKSRFQSGLQCHKRLWLEVHRRDLMPPVDAATQAIFDQGNRVGELAQQRWPGGVLVDAPYYDYPAAEKQTRELLADPNVPAIYEAAFEHNDVRMRADIVVKRSDGGLEMVEVKSTSKTKDVHHTDVGIQFYIMHGAGSEPVRAGLMHLNSAYVYQGGEYDLQELFTVDDLTDTARDLQTDIPAQLGAMQAMLAVENAPDIAVGPHCEKPYTCPFVGHCWAGIELPEHPVTDLPRIRSDKVKALQDAGFHAIPDVPDDCPGLNVVQQRVRDCVKSGKPYFGPGLSSALAPLEYPIYFLDYESFMSALPLWPGTRPYQAVPFQWSLHRLDTDGTLHHDEYLHDDPGDPRPAFIESQIAALGDTGSIVVYSPYEKRMLRECAAYLPEHAKAIQRIRDRLFDLLPVMRRHVYHLEFHGSWSIKHVLPALVPGAGYADLEIADGNAAARTYGELIAPETSPQRHEKIRADLLAYCKQDTLAMVDLLRALGLPGNS